MTPPSVAPAAGSVIGFRRADDPDLFLKCRRFGAMVRGLKAQGLYQSLYRVNLTSGLDHRITIADPHTGAEREVLCFDSNSYLHLHRHPRVVAAVRRALDEVGYGTPSSQLLCGTNRYLHDLEDTISRFHGREATLVFSSGYTANLGAVTGLVRPNDLVVRDRFSHTSIHDACRATGSRFQATYAHRDLAALEAALARADADPDCMGKLIVTDGVFSMHGRLAPLDGLVALARRYGARLMLDEAHATGVIGATGRGLEERYGLDGAVDVLMGTFSKAPGTVGGYVCGSREMVDYLRFFAHASMFTAAPPAALCAGVDAAFGVMDEEPWHRERLWENTRALARGLHAVGLHTCDPPESPIITVFIGSQALLWLLSRDLLEAGVKAGNVAFPAVPRGEAILRLTANTRHTPEDIERAVTILERLGRAYGILGRTRDEIRAIGKRLELTPGGAP